MIPANFPKRLLILLLSFALACPIPISAQKDAAKNKEKDKKAAEKARRDADKWVAQTMKKMSLEEKLGQMLLVFYFGGFTSAGSPEYAELLEEIEKHHVGGFVVRTRGNAISYDRSQVYPTAVLANQMQRRSQLPLFVAADFERGTAMRLDEGTSFPYPMAVAAAGNPADAYTMGKITALEARACGVNWIFGPVADVNNNPDNPIINTRSYGEDPKRVGEFVAAFTRGVEENGAIATAKHFPGHGDVSTDSHVDLPTVKGDRARLESVELPPFRAAIEAGASTIMTGHLAVPAFEPNPDVPATLSSNILTGLLRKEMKFEGIVVTDAMDMGGVTVRYPPAEAAIRSIVAGADVLLVPPIVESALSGLKDAVASGRITVPRIDESVRRILQAKARLGLNVNRFVDVDALNSAFRRPEFVAAAQDITDRGITLLRNEDKLIPLDATRPQRLLLLNVSGDPEPVPGEEFEREIRWRVDSLQVVRTDTRFNRAENAKLPPPQNYDAAIVGLFVRVGDRKGTVGLPAAQAELVKQVLDSGKQVVMVGFGSPYLIAGFPKARTWLGGFSTFDVVQRSAARALFGQIPIGGHIPVSVPDVVKIGDGLSSAAIPMKLRAGSAEMDAKLASVYKLLDDAVADHAFPGGVLAVGHGGEVTIHPFGHFTYETNSPADSAETLFDLASISKAVGTTTLVQMLNASGRLGLDTKVIAYVPEFAAGPNPEWRAKITIRNLITHTSGLPTHKKLWEGSKNKQDVLAKIYAEPLTFEPGTKAVYSDLGFMLLGEIVERISGKPIDEYARERIFGPLQMSNSMYAPAKSLWPRVAPAEDDKDYRKKIVQGEVHDENCFAMGGVCGHAGMFATAGVLALFGQMMLNGGIYGHTRILSRRQIDLFASQQPVGEMKRGIGWMVPAGPSFAGKYSSPRGFGHTGFTGTSLWIDPGKDLFVVLLTNRVYPTRANEKIEQVRPAIHDAIYEALGLTP